MKPDVITSCCGALFSTERQGISAGIAHLPRVPLEINLFLGMGSPLPPGISAFEGGVRSSPRRARLSSPCPSSP
jgi:hypothetical protein